MAKDLSQMSLEELKAHEKQVQAALKDYDKKRRAECLTELRAVAKSYGFALEEVVGGAVAKGAGSRGVAKYANPADPSQTWTGRGRQPKWIKAALDAGQSLDAFAI